MEQERDTQTIFFKDLLISILRHWKQIIIAMLIGALLLGGLQFFERARAVRQSENLTGEELTQREQVQQALEDAETRIVTQQTYLATSPLMTIDPNQVYQATLTLYVHTDYKILPNATYQDPDNISAILAAYQRVLSDGSVIESLAEQTEISSQYLHELFSCTTTISHPGILNITISASDEDLALQLLVLLKQAMLNSSSQIAQQTGEHTLEMQTSAPILRSDASIAKQQTEAFQRLTALKDQKSEWQKLSTALTFSGDDANPFLHAALGAILGLVIVCLYACISHISSDKVYSERTLKNRLNIKVLGRAPSSGQYSKKGRWLRKIEGRVLSENAMDVIAANVRNLSGGNSILVVGSAPEEDRVALREAFTKAQITFTDCGDLLSNADAYDALAKCHSILLLEKCNHSTYENIQRVMDHVADQNKPLLGCVLLDG